MRQASHLVSGVAHLLLYRGEGKAFQHGGIAPLLLRVCILPVKYLAATELFRACMSRPASDPDTPVNGTHRHIQRGLTKHP